MRMEKLVDDCELLSFRRSWIDLIAHGLIELMDVEFKSRTGVQGS